MTDGKGKLHQIPENWVWATVENIGVAASGSTPSTKEPEFWGGEIPWVTPADLTGYKEKFIEKGARNITKKGLNSCSARLLPKGTVLFSSRAPIGYAAIAKNPIATNQGFKNLILPDGIFNEYIYHYLKGNKQLAERYASGTTFKELSATRFRRVPVPLPPTREQHRIVSKLEELFTRLDAGVESLRNVKAQLQLYRQAILNHAFNGKLTEEWRKAHKNTIEPATTLLEQIRKERRKKEKEKYREPPKIDTTNLPELPETWTWTTIGEITVVVRGASPRPKGNPKYFGGNIPWIKISDISKEKGKYVLKTKDTVNEEGAKKSRLLKKGTLILSNSGTVCVPKILAVDGCIHDGFVAFPNLTRNIDMFFLYYFFEHVRPRIIQENRQGVTQVNLNTTIVRNIILPLPSFTEQQEIVGIVESYLSVDDEVKMITEQCLLQSECLRQSILKTAFEGKLVAQDPSDEPADVLLERIRQEKERQSNQKKGTKSRMRISETSQRRLNGHVE